MSIRDIPQVPSVPFIGSTLQFISNPRMFCGKNHAKYGPVFRATILNETMVFISDTEVWTQLLRKEGKWINVCWPESAKQILGNGSTGLMNEETHKKFKRFMNKTFSPKVIQTHVPKILSTTRLTLMSWNEKRMIKNMTKATQGYAFDMAINFLFGEKLFTNVEHSLLKHHFNNINEGVLSVPLKVYGTKYYRALKSRTVLYELLEQKVEQERSTCMSVDDDVTILFQFATSIDPETNELLSTENVVDILLSIIFAAHDTISSLLCSILLVLSYRKDIEAQLFEEQQAIVQRYGDCITADILKHMRGVESFLYEVSRILPIAEVLFREIKQDQFELPGFGYVLPKSTKVSLNMQVDLIGSTEKYVLPLEVKVMQEVNLQNGYEKLYSKNASIASIWGSVFGIGRRSCPGKTLAQTELRIFIAELVREYTVDIPATTFPKWEYNPVPRPKGKLGFRLNKRAQISSFKNVDQV